MHTATFSQESLRRFEELFTQAERSASFPAKSAPLKSIAAFVEYCESNSSLLATALDESKRNECVNLYERLTRILPSHPEKTQLEKLTARLSQVVTLFPNAAGVSSPPAVPKS